MKEEFDLSDKINKHELIANFILVEDVKEFIKRLKEAFTWTEDERFLIERINELAGNKLIDKKEVIGK